MATSPDTTAWWCVYTTIVVWTPLQTQQHGDVSTPLSCYGHLSRHNSMVMCLHHYRGMATSPDTTAWWCVYTTIVVWPPLQTQQHGDVSTPLSWYGHLSRHNSMVMCLHHYRGMATSPDTTAWWCVYITIVGWTPLQTQQHGDVSTPLSWYGHQSRAGVLCT